jgi:hypothetical protein
MGSFGGLAPLPWPQQSFEAILNPKEPAPGDLGAAAPDVRSAEKRPLVVDGRPACEADEATPDVALESSGFTVVAPDPTDSIFGTIVYVRSPPMTLNCLGFSVSLVHRCDRHRR